MTFRTAPNVTNVEQLGHIANVLSGKFLERHLTDASFSTHSKTGGGLSMHTQFPYL